MRPPAPPTAEPVVVVGAGLGACTRPGGRTRPASRSSSSRRAIASAAARGRTSCPAARSPSAAASSSRPTTTRWRACARSSGLELVAHGFSFDRRPTPGRRAPTAEEVAGLMAARAPEPWNDDDVAAEDVLRRRHGARRAGGSGPPAGDALTVPLRRVSARRTFGGAQHVYDPASPPPRRQPSVARELARRLGKRVRLRRPAVAVAHDERGAAVRCGDGATLSAAAVVLAVPLPLLLDLDVEPGLPPAIAAAAQRSVFGDAASSRPARRGAAGREDGVAVGAVVVLDVGRRHGHRRRAGAVRVRGRHIGDRGRASRRRARRMGGRGARVAPRRRGDPRRRVRHPLGRRALDARLRTSSTASAPRPTTTPPGLSVAVGRAGGRAHRRRALGHDERRRRLLAPGRRGSSRTCSAPEVAEPEMMRTHGDER